MTGYDVLEIIKESIGSVSGEDMSRRLGVSRAMIWKTVCNLRDEGYPIRACTKKGYWIEKDYDVLNEYEVGRKLLDGDLIYVKETGSTNSLLREMAIKNELREGTCLFCDRQTKGRGRLGREWYSPGTKNIAMSLLLKPEVSPAEAGGFSLMAGVCACEALKAVSGADLRIKWPNDILIGERKVCGILTDMVSEFEKVNFLVIGIGINVFGTGADMPEELAAKAATLEDISLSKDIIPGRAAIIREIIERFNSEYPENRRGISGRMINKWKDRSGAIGKKIEYYIDRKQKFGTIREVMKNGALCVETAEGNETVHSGMIFELER